MIKDFQWQQIENFIHGQTCKFDESIGLISIGEDVLSLDHCVENCLTNPTCTHFNYSYAFQECTLLNDLGQAIKEDDAFYEEEFSCGFVQKNF